jgi:two-component system, LytTR family, sensor kinase
MDIISNIAKRLNRQEIKLFVGFYVISAIIYYTATWITWGGLEPDHPPYFDIEEFAAAAGTDFIISFFVTIPIWYITTVCMEKQSLQLKLLAHIFFLPVFILVCYYAQYTIKYCFGWSMFWGGQKVVWTLYNLMLFYMVQFGFIHAYNYFKMLKKEELEKVELRELALKSEMNALKAQLNPHFLHNLFNSINATIPPEQERTRALIIQLSDLFRYQNYAAQKEFVTIKEEIGFLDNYLQLMKVRLKERLNYSFEVSSNLNNIKIAPMLLQPLIENAIIHGISPKIEPSTLTIKINRVSDKLNISIEDTGVGIVDKTSMFQNGLGLSNTTLRLLKMYNSELIIEDNVPSGTKISFKI